MSLLFQSMLFHGFVPKGLLTSTIVPIPMGNRKSMNVSENYRGIALGSVIGKVFDRIILSKHWDTLKSSDMQFGFKPKHSTTQCTFVVEEVIQYYQNRESDMYVCMLDASKAFDRVHYVKMFSLLLKKGVCPLVARVLSTLYTNQSVNIKWGNTKSSSFEVSNGVKQGGILSPIMFAVYMDEMFMRLKNAGYGCYIGSLFVGSLGYADDSILLSPSIYALKLMLNIVHKYGNEYNVKFNPEKSKLLCYLKGRSSIKGIRYGDVYIEAVDCYDHLGNPLGPGVKNTDVNSITIKFIQSVNYVLSVFGKCHSSIKYQLFKSYCMPLYGAMLWDFSLINNIEFFLIQWRKCIRKVWGLPSTTHCNLLDLICQDIPVIMQLHKRFMKFFCSLINSENVYLNTCAKLALNGSCSKLCNSITHICHKYHLNRYSIGVNNGILLNSVLATDQDLMCAGNILDLCYIRDSSCTMLSSEELNELLMFFCTK